MHFPKEFSFLQCFPEQGAGKAPGRELHPKFISQALLLPFSAISSSFSTWYSEQGLPAPFPLISFTWKCYTSESKKSTASKVCPPHKPQVQEKTQEMLKESLPLSTFMKGFVLWQHFLWWTRTTPVQQPSSLRLKRHFFSVQSSIGGKEGRLKGHCITVLGCFFFFHWDDTKIEAVLLKNH